MGDREKFIAKMKGIRIDLKRQRSFIAELDRCKLP